MTVEKAWPGTDGEGKAWDSIFMELPEKFSALLSETALGISRCRAGNANVLWAQLTRCQGDLLDPAVGIAAERGLETRQPLWRAFTVCQSFRRWRNCRVCGTELNLFHDWRVPGHGPRHADGFFWWCKNGADGFKGRLGGDFLWRWVRRGGPVAKNKIVVIVLAWRRERPRVAGENVVRVRGLPIRVRKGDAKLAEGGKA